MPMGLRQRAAALWLVLLVGLLVACGAGPAPTATTASQPATTTTTTTARTTADGTTTRATATMAATTGATATRTTATTRATTGTATATRTGTTAAGTTARTTAAQRVTTYPLTVRDDAGRSVTLARCPERIVSLAPSNTEILYALGLGDRIAAVDQFSDFPEPARAKPKIGGVSRPSIEEIVALAPDVVMAAGITSRDTIGALEGQGLTVVVLNPRDLPGVLENILLVGQLTDSNAEALRVRNGLDARVNAVGERLRGVANRPRVYFEIDPEQFYTAGPNSFINDLLVRAGGANIAADAQTPFPQLSAEAIIARDPEVIVMGHDVPGATPEALKARPGWANISAVRNDRVAAIDPDLTNRPGPRVVDGLEQLARIFHPTVFR
ncbi:MAG: ABC transporter substrate-binding protein [Chloroflexota bacterium]|nr:ABC transporter substrate-binding protein [Chloroflexota bacterium]